MVIGVRSAIPAASQLPGRGPVMWMLPLYLHIKKKSVDDDDDDLNRRVFVMCPEYLLLLEWSPFENGGNTFNLQCPYTFT